MPITVHIPSHLRTYSAGAARVLIDPGSGDVRGILCALRLVHPGVVARVLDETGRVRQHVNLFVGNENARDLRGLETPAGDGAEVFILPSVTGG